MAASFEGTSPGLTKHATASGFRPEVETTGTKATRIWKAGVGSNFKRELVATVEHGLHVERHAGLQRFARRKDPGITEPGKLKRDRQCFGEAVLEAELGGEDIFEVHEPGLSLGDDDEVQLWKTAMRNTVTKVDPVPKIFQSADLFRAGARKGGDQEFACVHCLLCAADNHRLAVFVEFAPLSTGPLEGRDRETVPRSDEEQRKCARSESGGWVVPDSDRRQTGLASLAQLSLPFGRSGAGG